MIGLKGYGESYDGKLIPMATNMSIDGTGAIYSDNRGTHPWTDYLAWHGAVAYVLRQQGTVYTPPPTPKAYHLGTLYELDMITDPAAFYCPAQPISSSMFGIPYRYENYTNKGGYAWGTFAPVPLSGDTGPFVRTSFNYWVHDKIRWSELHAGKIILVDNLQDWNAIPHRKSGYNSSPHGVSAAFADGHVTFCVNDDLFKKTATFNGVALWPGCDTPRTDDGPGNIRASFVAILSALSQAKK